MHTTMPTQVVLFKTVTSLLKFYPIELSQNVGDLDKDIEYIVVSNRKQKRTLSSKKAIVKYGADTQAQINKGLGPDFSYSI